MIVLSVSKTQRPTRSHIDENMDADAWRSCKADED